MARKDWTVKSDIASDKRLGIKQGSKRDDELDKKRGLLSKPAMKAAHKAAKR